MFRTYAIRSAILSLIVNLGFLWLVNDAMSADYYTVSVGQGQLKHLQDDGWWYQHGFGVERQENGSTWSVGAGWKLTSTLNFELDYRTLPHYSQVAGSVSDQALAKSCFPCGEAVTMTYIEGTAHGIGSSLVYQPFKWGPYVRAGGFLVQSTYYFSGDSAMGNGALYPHGRETEIHLRPFGGIGVEYKNITVEYTRFPNVGTEFSPFRSASTIQIGMRF